MIDQRNGFSIQRAWIVTRREVRDTLRDWRLVAPIAFLTIVFPALMQITADAAQRWAIRWGGEIIGERLMPFLMMIVGFFPISFSLVIALETFVGEKERHSLEPLLATPLSNAELYWGKTLAAMIPPLIASYLGLTVYLVGLYFIGGWSPPLPLLAITEDHLPGPTRYEVLMGTAKPRPERKPGCGRDDAWELFSRFTHSKQNRTWLKMYKLRPPQERSHYDY